MDYYPQRIVCLTEETTEMLYLLGEEDRIVGISGFTVRPKRARKEKPKVSAFIDASIQEIIDLQPDLVIGFSDIQANIAQELIKKGITVWVNNHRSVEEIVKMMVQLGALVGQEQKALDLVNHFYRRKEEIQEEVQKWGIQPKVYFEEWYNPIISGIKWVSELIEMAGGKDIFQELSTESLAKNRIIEDHHEIIKRSPDMVLVSWCGKKYKAKKMFCREGWTEFMSIQNKQVIEIDSSIILQPGPASIFEGLEILHQHFKNWKMEQNG